MLQLQCQYQSQDMEKLKLNLANTFGSVLPLPTYSIIHVKTFASSPSHISKGQYSTAVWTISDFEYIKYESEMHHYINVLAMWCYWETTKTTTWRTSGFVSSLPPTDPINLGNVTSLVLSWLWLNRGLYEHKDWIRWFFLPALKYVTIIL